MQILTTKQTEKKIQNEWEKHNTINDNKYHNYPKISVMYVCHN